MGEICQEGEGSRGGFCLEEASGASSGVGGGCGCRQETGRAAAQGHQVRPQEPLRSRASMSQGAR